MQEDKGVKGGKDERGKPEDKEQEKGKHLKEKTFCREGLSPGTW